MFHYNNKSGNALRERFENCALLGYNAASRGNPLPTFRDNVSVPSSKVDKSKKPALLRLIDP
jgi:hypothetical protein